MKLEGIITALATPFFKGQLDKSSLKNLLHLQLEQNISGLVINGTTAESPCLTTDEVKCIINYAKKETKKNIPLILGVGGNSTTHTLHNIKQATKWKADMVLVVVPYYNKPPQRGLIKHFMTLADNSPLPIILYNVPARTVVGLDLESIKKLSKHPNIVAIKEASGDMSFGKQIIKLKNQGTKWRVLSGDDDSVMELCQKGAMGGVCVLSHIAGGHMQQLYQKIKQSDMSAVKKYKTKYGNLLKAIYTECNPIGIKMTLKLMGIFQSAQMRSPLVPLTKIQTIELQKQLKQAGFL